MRSFLALFLLAGAVFAQGLPYDRQSIDMLPGEFARGPFYGPFYRAKGLFDRVTRDIAAADTILRNPQLQPAQRRKVQKQRNELGARRAKILRDLDEAMMKAGLTPERLDELKRIPRGPLRHERFNHAVLLQAPDLSAKQKAVLAHLVAATDGAQATVAEQRSLLTRGLDAKKDEIMRRRVESTCNQQIRAIEQRFWRMAYYVLTPAQMAATRDLRSNRYKYVPEMERQFYTLPDLAPAQASRLRSCFREFESEVAADQARVRQIQVKMRNRALPGTERQKLQAEQGEAYKRINVLRTAQRDAIRKILTEEQLQAFRALPPIVNLGIRGRPPWEIVRGMRLRADQLARLETLGKDIRTKLQAINKESREAARSMAGADLGPESPQMMTMQMNQMGARGKTMDANRELGQSIFLDVCDAEQVASWVVAPSIKP